MGLAAALTAASVVAGAASAEGDWKPFAEKDAADRAVQQTIEVAKAAVDLARQVRQHAVTRMQKVMARHGLPDGIYAHDNDCCKLQRLE